MNLLTRTALAAAIAGAPSCVWSATFQVPCQTDGPGGLIDVLRQVQTTGTDDTITLAAGCVYRLTQPASILSNGRPIGLPAQNSTLAGDLVIEGQGARIERADGAPEFGLLHVAEEAFTIRDVIFANGVSRGQPGQRGDANGGARALGGAYNGSGGAILSEDVRNLTLINCRFIGNRAIGGTGGDGTGVGTLDQASGGGGGGVGIGGAISHAGSGTLVISESAFVQNESVGGSGGGTVLGQISAGGGGGGSGGIGGLVGEGGGLAGSGGGGGGAGFSTSSLDDGGDGAAGGGGGAGFVGGGARLLDGQVRGGTGGRFGGGGGTAAGGAIYVSGGLFDPSLSLINTSFMGNLVQGGDGALDGGGATAAGGAVFARNAGLVQFRHVTFVDNVAAAGSHGATAGTRDGASAFGGGAYIATSAGPLLLASSALAENEAMAAPASGAGIAGLSHGRDLFATITSLGYNLVHTHQGVTGLAATDLPEATDPGWMVGPGAVPLYFLPRLGSALLDAVPLAQCPIAFDQRGIARPQGSACDIGSVEATQLELARVFTDGFE